MRSASGAAIAARSSQAGMKDVWNRALLLRGFDSACLKAIMIWIFPFFLGMALAYLCCGREGISLAGLWALCGLGNHECTSQKWWLIHPSFCGVKYLPWGGGGWAKVCSQVPQQPRKINIFSSRTQVQTHPNAVFLSLPVCASFTQHHLFFYRPALALWAAITHWLLVFKPFSSSQFPHYCSLTQQQSLFGIFHNST